MVVENNYGYAPPPDATSNGDTTQPGIERVDIKRGGKGCRTVWKSQEISPSTVPKLSLATGLVYMYTKPPGTPDKLVRDGGRLPHREDRVAPPDRHRASSSTCTTPGITISPQGVLYAGVLGGTVALADG